MRSLTDDAKLFLLIHNGGKMSGPKRSIKITDHSMCTSTNVIYCITRTYCDKLYISETGRRLGDRFREYLSDVERNDKDASKSVASHFNLPNHWTKHIAVCGLSLRLGSSESPKHDNKNLSSKSALLIPTVSTSAFHSTNLFLFSRHHIPTDSVASFSAYKPTHNPRFLQSLWRRDNVHINELVNRTLSWLIFQTKAIATFGIEIFQEEQQKAIDMFFEGNDVFVSLPTGSGKSLIYRIFNIWVMRREAVKAEEANAM